MKDEWGHVWEHVGIPITRMSLQEEFHELVTTWRENTQFQSSITAMVADRAYLHIVAMGTSVVPLILRELSERPDQWFWALSALTQADPVRQAHRGQIGKMRDDWLRWADAAGYHW
ncbi:MAG: hypothetical protein O7I93_16070 [Gemmatimonadetes bacterium]|nr:hypothetical protein [Gemmatimonadota bacterium]